MAAKSVTRTLRLEADLNAFLDTDAAKESVTPSFLVNKALRKYVEWDAFAEKFGIVSLPTAMLNKCMEMMTEAQAREIGKWVGTNHVREFLTFWFKEVTARTLVQSYPRLTARYARAFEYEERSEGSSWVIVLKHGSGKKWSAYYEELLRGVFANVVQREVAVESTDDQVVARFSLA